MIIVDIVCTLAVVDVQAGGAGGHSTVALSSSATISGEAATIATHHTLDFLLRHGIQALDTHRRFVPLGSASASAEDGDSRCCCACFGSSGLTIMTDSRNHSSPGPSSQWSRATIGHEEWHGRASEGRSTKPNGGQRERGKKIRERMTKRWSSGDPAPIRAFGAAGESHLCTSTRTRVRAGFQEHPVQLLPFVTAEGIFFELDGSAAGGGGGGDGSSTLLSTAVSDHTPGLQMPLHGGCRVGQPGKEIDDTRLGYLVEGTVHSITDARRPFLIEAEWGFGPGGRLVASAAGDPPEPTLARSRGVQMRRWRWGAPMRHGRIDSKSSQKGGKRFVRVERCGSQIPSERRIRPLEPMVGLDMPFSSALVAVRPSLRQKSGPFHGKERWREKVSLFRADRVHLLPLPLGPFRPPHLHAMAAMSAASWNCSRAWRINFPFRCAVFHLCAVAASQNDKTRLAFPPGPTRLDGLLNRGGREIPDIDDPSARVRRLAD